MVQSFKDAQQHSANTTRFKLDNVSDMAVHKKVENAESKDYVKLPHNRFYRDEKQPRKIFTHDAILQLSQTMAVEQYQPIIVWPADENGNHKIVDGERRWRASVLLGPDYKLEAKIDWNAPKREPIKHKLKQVGVNDAREPLHILELASVAKEAAESGLSNEEIARELGWVRENDKPGNDRVSVLLKLIEMPEEGLLLAQEDIVTDTSTLNYLRKINQYSTERFKSFCALIRKNGGVSRSDAKNEFLECKRITRSDPESSFAQLENSDDDENIQVSSGATEATVDNQGTTVTQPSNASGSSSDTDKTAGTTSVKKERTISKAAPQKSNIVKASHKLSVVVISTKELAELILGHASDGGEYEVVISDTNEIKKVSLNDLEIISIKLA